MCNDLSNVENKRKLILGNLDIADEPFGIARRLFKEGQIKVCPDDPGCCYQMTTANYAVFDT